MDRHLPHDTARNARFFIGVVNAAKMGILSAGQHLTGQKIRRGVRKSVQALEADIRDWIDHWNQNPRPFAWTKTAEEILNSLAEYLSKISGGAH